MSFVPLTPISGLQSMNGYDTVAAFAPNTMVYAFDEVYGGAELVYLPVPASTAFGAGTLVTVNPTNVTTTRPDGSAVTYSGAPVVQLLPVTATATRSGLPVYAAITASTVNDPGYASVRFGWFMKSGQYPILKTALRVNPNVRAFVSGTAGRFFPTSTTGAQIIGMRTLNTATVLSATSTVLCLLDRPMVSGVA